MGFFSNLFGGSSTAQPSEEKTLFPELVLLTSEEIPASVHFLQGAIKEGLGVELSPGEPSSTEFITGEFPVFMFQTKGILIQLKFMPFSYFDRKSTQFAEGNPSNVFKNIISKELRTLVGDHCMWVGASVMSLNATPITDVTDENFDPYFYIGKTLSAFCMEGITQAIIWPRFSLIRGWDSSMEQLLKSGTPLKIFA